MVNDLVQQEADTIPGLSTTVQTQADEINKRINGQDAAMILSEKVCATVAAFAANLSGLPKMTKFLVFGPTGAVLSYSVNLGTGSSSAEAITYAILETLIADSAGTVLVAGLEIGLATSLGGAVAGVAVGYGAIFGIDYLKDRFIGPSAIIKPNSDTKEYQFTVTGGSLSDFLKPRGFLHDILPDFVENVWDKYDLKNANKWSLASGDASENLVIEYVKESGFSFRDESNASLLRDIHSSSTEHKEVIDLILVNYAEDFKVSVNGTADHVYNLAAKTEQQLYELATSTDDIISKRTLLALDVLRSFSLESEKSLADPIDSADYSVQYIRDRAKFLFHTTHEDALPSDGNDTTFIDAQSGQTAYAGDGLPNPFTDDQFYVFGKDEDILGNDPMAGNDVMSGQNADDHLYPEFPKLCNDENTVTL